MALIRSRQALVGCRTQLVNHVRGAVKSFGRRLPKCPARSFHKRASEHIPEALWPALGPILEQIGSLTERIHDYDRKLETISKETYPETELLRQMLPGDPGVQHEQDPAQHQAIIERLPSWIPKPTRLPR